MCLKIVTVHLEPESEKTAGARSCCILELLVLKGLIIKCLLSVFLVLLPTGFKRFKLNDGPRNVYSLNSTCYWFQRFEPYCTENLMS